MFGIVNKPERVALNPTTGYDLDLVKIASDAERLLGYKVLKQTMSTNALALVLHGLGVEPFDKESVKTYKRKMAKRASGHFVRSEYESKGEWHQFKLSTYPNPVPEYVLNKAIEIKEKLPTAEFLVDQLIVGEHYIDPFLIVRDGSEEYYIEVWDEPEFEMI